MTRKQKKNLTRILIAAVLFAVLMILEHTELFKSAFANRWISLILYLIPFLIVGASVLRNAVLGILHGQMFDESFLMTLAAIGAFATSENSEACAVMLFYQIGELFQSYAVERSRKSIRDLMDIVPEFANVERSDGKVETVDPDDVEIGDILIIKPGEKIPVDGTVREGSSLINTAALTGESVPRTASPGKEVVSGCINGEGLLKIRADKCYEDSTVSRILEMVENASEKKSKTENFITRFARVYTPAVVGCALLLAFLPSLFTGEWATWIYRACTFLVISCPCALVISVPLSFFGGIGAASRQGVLVKGSNYLELLAGLDTLVSDKTGTLTCGNFTVTEVIASFGFTREDILKDAAFAEGASTHPIAKSIRDELLKSGLSVSTKIPESENISGQGLIARSDQDEILVGNRLLLTAHGITPDPIDAPAATIVYVAKNGSYCGAILIRDELKPEAASSIRRLKDLGVRRIVMLTGDRKDVAESVGAELGIDSVCAELLPQDKVEQVEGLLAQAEGKTLGFVGDGINDAPVLSRADVGIAMGSLGSDAAIEAADVVIMDDNLDRLPTVVQIARRTIGISRQNIIFALSVKLLILILGALGFANMWAAVFADVGVAVLCILNAMRLLIKEANPA